MNNKNNAIRYSQTTLVFSSMDDDGSDIQPWYSDILVSAMCKFENLKIRIDMS